MIETWQHEQDVNRLAFISDLHLFSNRCNADEHHELIDRAIAECDLCVWGGDLFDFRWSRLRNENESVETALRWLEDWYIQHPTTQFVFLDGNHDAHLPFSDALSEWSQKHDRFTCGLNCIRVHDTLLLHGDVIEGRGDLDRFADYRVRWQNKPNASQVASNIYDMAIATRIHKAAALAAHRRRATCIRLMRWMHGQPGEDTDGVRRIVFGHTHRRIRGYRLQGIEFHNGGAAIRHVPFAPVELAFD
ncbi:MAG: metallophosphoesterase [Planctomycetota bacterium]